MALERRDGQIEVVPSQQILNRVIGPDPVPLTCPEMIDRLTEKFGTDRFRARADAPYVVGLVLSEPLPKQFESKAAACLKKGAAFMKTVEKVFIDFVDDLKLETEKTRYPLVLLIFETDDDFMRFAAEEMGGVGLSASSILGYYSALTNRLAIRMSECYTFETPLHEAIHQQVYNRGLMQRLSPAPAWFNEGIATGFQGNGEKINVGPLRVNSRYARAAMRAKTVDWDNVVSEDKAFQGDVLAAEAYSHAWSIHWFLVTKYRKQYVEYLRLLSQKPALQNDDARQRIDDFERIFGKRVGKLQSEFPQWLEAAAKKQKVTFSDATQPGTLVAQKNLADIEITALADSPGEIPAVEGRLRNMSQIRPMSFYVTLETDAGMYADWFLPNVAPQKVLQLSKQLAEKEMKGGPGGPTRTFQIKVKVAVPESKTAQAWQRGELPAPVWSDR